MSNKVPPGADDPDETVPFRRYPLDANSPNQPIRAVPATSPAERDETVRLKPDAIALPPPQAPKRRDTPLPGLSSTVRAAPPQPPAAAQSVAADDPATVDDSQIDKLFGNFRVVRKLGEGGMGIVYEAKHVKIGRQAAVKIMHREYAKNKGFATRFLNEARAVNIVQHQGIVEIFEYGQLDDDTLYLVMEYLQGESLQKRIDATGRPFLEAQVVKLTLQIAQALAAAHEKGVIHRDLKPDNIMLVPDPVTRAPDWVKILDFGIAKLEPNPYDPSIQTTEKRTGVGSVMGTPAYMAPEQFGRAETVDGRADVFSLGVILYQLLAGRLPYTGNSMVLLQRPVPKLSEIKSDVNPRLSLVVQKMMSVASTERPTMAEVVQALSELRVLGNSPRKAFLQPNWIAPAGLALVFITAMVLWLTRATTTLTVMDAKTHALAAIQAGLQSDDTATQKKALQAVGQSGDMGHRQMLEKMLRHRDPEIVSEAARALGRIGAVESQGVLLRLLSGPQHNPALELEVADALAHLNHPVGLKLLTDALNCPERDKMFRSATLLLARGNLAGAPTLWPTIWPRKAGVSEMTYLSLLGQMTQAGDAQARSLMEGSLRESPTQQGRMFAAWNLGRLGDDNARVLLTQTAKKPGPSQLLAAQLLASLGETTGYELFEQVAQSTEEPDDNRELAITGLADCGREESLSALDKVLNHGRTSQAVRLAAAGAILRIAAGEKTQLAQQSLNWARAALGSDDAATRALAAAALGEINSDDTIPPLSRALRDEQREVQRAAARALGKKSARAALVALAGSLDDKDVEVRAAGMRAISRVVSALKARGDKDADKLVIKRLDALCQTGSEQDRVVASGILLQLGDTSQQGKLRAALSSRDPLVRKLALEMASDEDPTIFMKAVKDPDRSVQFVAARRLADKGTRHAPGIAVLREIANVGDLDGLVAYGKLKKLGEAATPPEGLAQMLRSGDLHTQLDVLDAIADLPAERAFAMLSLASRDPASVIRRRAAEVAGDILGRGGNVAFLNMIKTLLHDPDALVRSGAAELLLTLKERNITAQVKPKEGVTPAPPIQPTPPDRAAHATQAPVPMGHLKLIAEESVRVQIDQKAPQAVTTKLLDLTVGKHHLTYVGGEQDVIVAANKVTTATIPTTYNQQLLSDGNKALQAGRLDLAQGYFDRLRTMEQRGRVSLSLLPDISLSRARLYEAQKDLPGALSEYSKLSDMAVWQKRPDLRNEWSKAMERLASTVGHAIIFQLSPSGKCERSDLHLLPGNHLITVGQGKDEVVRIQAGKTVTLDRCGK